MLKKICIPPVFVLLSLLLIVLFYFIIPKFNLIPFPFNLGGILIAFLGFSIMGKSRDLFRKHKTTLDIEKSSSLITEGIFARTRNPMYMGMFLLLLGFGICFRNLLSILVPFVFAASIRILFITAEERMLSETFGQHYLDYKKRVRRWI